MARNVSSEVIQRHVPSQMSMFPEVTPPGDNKMSGASSHKRLWTQLLSQEGKLCMSLNLVEFFLGYFW